MAQTPEEKGKEIAVEADKRDTGWGDSTATLSMILRNQSGAETTRELQISTLELLEDGDKSLVVFDTPPDVKGTALLTFSHRAADDDQWLYLPALKRVKRIASNNQSGPFMGSEFAYEDLSSQEIDKFTYKYIGDEEANGMPCFVIERVPTNENSGYTKQVAWLDQAEYRIQKVDFYDRKGDLMKTLTASDYKQYLDKFWRPGRMEMVNHVTGKSTVLQWKDYQFGAGLSERDFDQNALKRAR
ncbi:MAG: outer membrane lipoprotein-sorting protein [Candidatus Hydrogenedens sp.]|nr:outer membrane lipoprotein-sorting protein [Candidatus Hydrogenedens sp.]